MNVVSSSMKLTGSQYVHTHPPTHTHTRSYIHAHMCSKQIISSVLVTPAQCGYRLQVCALGELKALISILLRVWHLLFHIVSAVYQHTVCCVYSLFKEASHVCLHTLAK